MKRTATVISLGAGVQSSALLLMSDRGMIERADFAIFADTQAEPSEVYHWLEFLKSSVSIPVITVSKGSIHDDTLKGNERFASIPSFVRNPDGSQGIARRQCTADYKLNPVYQGIRQRLGYIPKERVKHDVRVLIGISCDEAHRMKDPRLPWVTNVYPLVELWKHREWAKQYVMEQVGKTPPRSACWMCPFHSNGEWRRLKETDPNAWAKAVEFDEAIRTQEKFEGESYLHRSMVPLKEVDLAVADTGPDLFGNECEGMCGV